MEWLLKAGFLRERQIWVKNLRDFELLNRCSTLFYVIKNKPECNVFFEEKAGEES